MDQFVLCQKCGNDGGAQCECDIPLGFAIREKPVEKKQEKIFYPVQAKAPEEHQFQQFSSLREKRNARIASRCAMTK